MHSVKPNLLCAGCLGMAVEERRVPFDEVASFAECGLCGTAAVLSPVGKISGAGKEISFASGWQEDCVLTKLRETLTGIQTGEREAPTDWIFEIG